MNSAEVYVAAFVQLCDFCGCQKSSPGRCSSCGAASAIVPFAVINGDSPALVEKEIKSKKYFIYFTVTLLAGLLVQICSVFDYQFRSPFSSVAGSQDTVDRQGLKPFAFEGLKPEVEYSIVDLKQKLDTISSNYEFYYAGVNRAATAARPVVLKLQKTSADVVLVLSSFKAVHWQLSNPHAVNIVAIVYASELGVSNVTGDLEPGLLLRSKRPLGTYYQSRQCNCFAPGVYQCAGNDLQSTVQRIENAGRGRVTGIASGFTAATLPVPQTTPEKIFHRDMKQQRADKIIKTRCFEQAAGNSSFFKPLQTHPAD